MRLKAFKEACCRGEGLSAATVTFLLVAALCSRESKAQIVPFVGATEGSTEQEIPGDRGFHTAEELTDVLEDGQLSEDPEAAGPDTKIDQGPPEGFISFDLPVADEQGGATVSGWAGSLQYESERRVVLSEQVVIRRRDLKIQADRIELDLDTEKLTAEGNVILDQGPRRVSSERLDFDLGSETGSFHQAQAFVAPDFYFSGSEITKVGPETYTVTDGVFTSCSDEVPDWSFKLARAQVTVDGYARVHNARMRIKKLPVLYTPYMLWPVKSSRTSGLLVPKFGYNELRGSYVGLAYYQVLGDSYDTTFLADLYGEEYYGFGNEFRYRPSVNTDGFFRGYVIRDPIADEDRWKVSWRHTTEDLLGGMRAVVSYTDFSDFEFFRDFEREFNDITIRRLYSTAFLSGSWGSHSLNIQVDDRQTFIREGTVIRQRQQPEVEYRIRSLKLGRTPLYLGLLSSGSFLSVERTGTLDEQYGRVDLFPRLTLPIRSAPWISTSLTAGGRATWYGDSVSQDGSEFTGESLTRFFPTASADVVGPSFSRVYDAKVGRFAKFKHLIEPRWRYSFVDDFDDQELVPLFDEIDNLKPSNIGGFSLVQRLLAKPEDEEVDGGSREIMSFELGQSYSLDDTQPFETASDGTTTQKSPISARLRFNPSATTNVQARASYSAFFKQLRSTSFSGGFEAGRHRFGATWFTRYNAEAGEKTSNQVRLFTGIELWKNRLRLDTQINYDVLRDFLQQQRHMLSYTSQCFSVQLEFRDFESNRRKERDYRISVNLKNVGTFLDFASGERETF